MENLQAALQEGQYPVVYSRFSSDEKWIFSILLADWICCPQRWRRSAGCHPHVRNILYEWHEDSYKWSWAYSCRWTLVEDPVLSHSWLHRCL